MSEESIIEEGKVWAIIGYLGILFLVPLLAKKDNKFALYHAKQGLILFIAEIVIWVVAFILMFIRFVGWAIAAILWIAILVLFIIGIVNAATGKYKALPLIGQIAEKWKI
jgi:uncharacterized membrane protein